MSDRDEAAKRIAMAASPKVGIGWELIIPIVVDAIPRFLACLKGYEQSPQDFIKAHTVRRTGQPRKPALKRLAKAIQSTATERGQSLSADEAESIALEVFHEGKRHGERVGAVMRGE